MIPPLANGNADLDKAYDAAIFAMPEVRAKVFAAQQAQEEAKRKAASDAEAKAQKEKLEKARKASGSLSLSAPGLPPGPQTKKQGRGTSVRDSIAGAVREVTEKYS